MSLKEEHSQEYLDDFKIIKKVLAPCFQKLEEEKINTMSLLIFLSTFIKELLGEIDDKRVKEVLIKIMFD